MHIKRLFILFICLTPSIGLGQINLVSDAHVPHSKIQEMKWWEFSLANNDCESQTITLNFSMDSSVVNCKLYWKDTLLQKNQIVLPPNSQGYLKVFHKIFTEKDTLEVQLNFHSEKIDSTFQLKTYYNQNLAKTPHCFPQTSSGKFKIYTGNIKNPQVLVMDNQRNLIMENSSEAYFLDLSDYQKGNYIIQIGEEEFVVEKL